MLLGATYNNCDLPSVRRTLEDPELYLDSLKKGTRVIFDEIHRLNDPSQLLKIAVDEYPHLKIVATGSSTLSATKKFRDSLTGRKQTIFLPPVLWEECVGPFGVRNLDRRLLHGGLPEPLLSQTKDNSFFSEWLESFYARDIQELFGIRSREGFLKLLYLLLRQSGTQIDYTKLTKLSELSRPTVKAHVEAMRIALAVFLLRPFHGGGKREIVRMPKCYTFDTGLISFAKGWDRIREDDRGLLWEHLILDLLRTRFSELDLYYWQSKSKREIDFVVKGGRKQVHALESKINPDSFEPDNLIAFRSLYPSGSNYVISPKVKTPYRRRAKGLTISYCSLQDLPQDLYVSS